MLDIVFLPWRDIHNFRKEGFRVREGNIIKSLSESSDVNKILIINRAKNFKSVITNNESGMEIKTELWPNKELITKCFGSRLYKVKENVFSLEMPSYLLNKGDNEIENNLFLQNYLMFVLKKVSNILQIDLDSGNTCVWSSDLTRSFVFKKLNVVKFRCKKIFDTIDNLTEHTSYTEKQREKNKEKYNVIDENVDVIFSVSEANFKKIYKNPTTKKFFVENGIDIDRFNMRNTLTENKKTKGNKIVCGYVGVIENRINFELLREVALKTPHIEYRLVGPILDKNILGIQRLEEVKNVNFLGPSSYEEIPRVIQDFDICMIPHVINSFTCSMSPLKFYEYLAANKPIIMTQVPPSEAVCNLKGVSIVNTKEEWIGALDNLSTIKEEILNNDIDRQQIIQNHSWGKIVKKMLNYVYSN
ncbi:glycosyltransferase [[Brevibacterium] frigoritolerans]|nr:glycosyltransferase [Peribacillus frigoritolerans]